VILGGILLALIGLADLVRSSLAGDTGAGAAPGGARNRGAHVRTSFAVATTAILWLVVCVLAVGGLGVPVWLVAIPVVLAAGWLATTSAAAATRTPAGIAPAVGVLVALLATLVWDNSTARLNGFVADWHRLTPASVLADVPLPALVVGSGVALFLIESANIVVRAALRPTASEPAAVTDAAPRPRRWWHAPEIDVPVVADLRGGRLIGPLERILIVALTLAGAFPVVAGLFAAKGIVRFPEISADGAGGSKAEYFLVGSLVSWAVALGLTGLIWIAVHG
jgi:nitrate reductase NapE component